LAKNPIKYRPRIIDAELKNHLKAFGGVLLTGPKMCGKTWSGLNQASSSIFIDEDDNIRRASLTPELVLEGDSPRLVDEWQAAPIYGIRPAALLTVPIVPASSYLPVLRSRYLKGHCTAGLDAL
jgi:hypothetical protein